METQINPSQEPVKPEPEAPSKKPKSLKNKKFKWWQSLTILLLTLVVSVGTGYYVSQKYFWSNMDMNRINEQLHHYKSLVDQNPNDPQHRVNLGYTYFLKNDNDNAIKQLKIAVDLDNKNYNAYLNLSIVYNDEKNFDEGLKMAQKAVELNPRDYKGQLQKGTIYRELKMYEDSLESLNQANQLMPGNVDIIFQIGLLAEERGLKKEAADIYKDALTYEPLYKPALEGLDRVASKDENN
jgi:tetratricopeptide (TPR) repeat protein